MSIRVLIIDDEPDLLEQAKIFLERANESLEVDTTNSGEAALEMLKENDFDAVIADYLLPDVDGVEILKKLRSQGDDITFLIFTGRASSKAEKKSLENGADGFYVKSGEPSSMYRKLADAIIEETSQ